MLAGDLPPLDQLDPAEAWKPWAPSANDPWNLKWAAHLYRRAAFGAPPYQPGLCTWDGLQQAVAQGHEATFAQLFDAGEALADYDRVMDKLAPAGGQGRYYDPNSDLGLHELQAWWLHRMIHSPFPLRERLTLFWHNHFATSIAKVRSPVLMMRQNQILRAHALGKFAPFVLAMSKDPAMLMWLDSNSNVKGKPNENYARELMELFTLGVGNYTEKDIREAARAFTGWHTNAQVNPGYYQPGMEGQARFVFTSSQHDYGEKTLFGQQGKWDGGDVVRILLEQPAAARFLVRKLYRAFVSEGAEPPDRLVEPLAEQLRKSDYDIGGLLRTILVSRLFFSNHAYRRRVKSPVEYVVGLTRTLDVQNSVGLSTALAVTLESMGQKLFAPPNVKGWDGGRAWLNSATLVARHNVAWSFLGDAPDRTNEMRSRGYYDQVPTIPRINVLTLLQPVIRKSSDEQVGFLLDFFLQGDANLEVREKLAGFLKDDGLTPAERSNRLRDAVHTILLMPENQLA
jgi:uncharacterized protein (DUF1800 family)